MKTNRGFVIPALVWVLVAVGGASMVAVPNFRPTQWFAKDKVGENNAALQKANADLLKAQQDAKAANDALEAARKADLDKQHSQLVLAQETASGASSALKKANPEPAVTLALSLLERTNAGLGAAIGELPLDKQQEVLKLVSDALSGVQSRLDDANAKLAAMDKSLAVTTSERDALKQRIPGLEAQVEAKTQAVIAQTTVVAQKQSALVASAQKVQEQLKESGSLSAQVDNLGRLLIVLGLLYVIAHFLLPSVAAEFPQTKILQGANRLVTSFVSAHEIVDQTQPPKL